MAELKAYKLKASTLLEVIVAMVVILIVFVLATGIYANVVRSAPSIRQQQLKANAASLIQDAAITQDWKDEVIERDSLMFQKTVVPYQGYQDLMLISVTVMEHGKQVAKVQKVVKPETDEQE